MRTVLAEAALIAYRGAGILLAPLSGLFLADRTRRGKEDPSRRTERRGVASHARPAGDLVWVHAASVGETMSVLPVVDWLTRRGLVVLFTSGTMTSATLAASRLPVGAFHQYVPLDVAPFVQRFLDHWRPSAALFVESEIWPTMVTELARRSIPQALVNARLSERSHKRWNLAPSLARLIFGRFSLVMAQSDADAARLAAVGATQPVITGNIKFDCQPLGVDQAELARMRLLIGDRPVLLAASTHAGEEAVVAAAARRIAARVTGLLTIIVPRHPDRRTDIADALALDGFKVALRSRGEDVRPETDVYLADTLGELGLFYRLASVALIGGSLIPAGGHNPIEAAQLDTAVLHGPHVHNAREIFTALDRSGGALEVRDAEELADAVTRLLKSPVDARAMARAGSELVLSGRGALERSCGFISEYLIAGGSDGRRAHNDRGQATG